MSAQFQEITNTATVLEGFYTRQADAAPIDYKRHDAYFMSLEDLTLSGVSNDIANLAMDSRRERHLIPEWRRAIENNMDGSGPPGLAQKMNKYCEWVTAGWGAEWFVETDTEDEDRYNKTYDRINNDIPIEDIPMYDENYTQRDEDIMEYNDERYEAMFC